MRHETGHPVPTAFDGQESKLMARAYLGWCNVYSFEVSAPRTTINRGEQLTATARHQALRRGAEVRFKNNTPNIVTMDVPGARTIGNEAVFTATNANGTIPINLEGLGRGAFSISYEVARRRNAED